ncbi:glycosyltransferase family 39 protein [Ensifer soli]|uniref:glycosyltransferase family 39 protein n=1 Tax=Ciceribacter sp. sgz301302 TaxID=3342379 RepID=UPI0035B7C40B
MTGPLTRGTGALMLALAVYFAVHVLVRLWLPGSLELDEGQQLFLAQWLAVGYDSQPPFYNWLQYGAVQLFGDTVLALSVLKNAMLFCCFGLVALTARLVMRDERLVMTAVAGLLTLPQIAFEAQRDLTHTVAVLFAAALFMAALVATLKNPRPFTYALTGIAVGLGLLSKYNFALLPLAAGLALLPDAAFRRRLFDPRFLLTVVVALLIVAPHALWFSDHVDIATGRTIGKMTRNAVDDPVRRALGGLLSLAMAVVAFSVPTIAAFWIGFGRSFLRSLRLSDPWTRMIGRMFLVILAAIAMMVLFGGVSNIKDRWLVPYLFLLPLYFSLKLALLADPVEGGSRRFARLVAVVMVGVPLALALRPPVQGLLGTYGKMNVAYGPAIAAILSTEPRRPSLIVTDDQQMAGNLRLQAPDVPVVIPGYEHFLADEAPDPARPVLIVWRQRGNPAPPFPEALRPWLAGKDPPVGSIAVPYHYGRPGDLYHFGYRWVEPQPR